MNLAMLLCCVYFCRYFDLRLATKAGTNKLYFTHGLYAGEVTEQFNIFKNFLDSHPQEVSNLHIKNTPSSSSPFLPLSDIEQWHLTATFQVLSDPPEIKQNKYLKIFDNYSSSCKSYAQSRVCVHFNNVVSNLSVHFLQLSNFSPFATGYHSGLSAFLWI